MPSCRELVLHFTDYQRSSPRWVRSRALQAPQIAPLRHAAGFPGLGLLRKLCQHDGHQGQLPYHSAHAFPRSYVGLPAYRRGRSLFPCLPQVDAVASVWPCSPLGPRKTPYIYARVRVSQATFPSTPFSIPPVKPCRRRRHFSPQTRLNRFVFLNLPILSLGNHLGVTVSPQFPLLAGYVTLPVDSRSPPLGLMLPHSRKQAPQTPPFSFAFQTYASPISRSEAHCR
jgi:hypothetical protein